MSVTLHPAIVSHKRAQYLGGAPKLGGGYVCCVPGGHQLNVRANYETGEDYDIEGWYYALLPWEPIPACNERPYPAEAMAAEFRRFADYLRREWAAHGYTEEARWAVELDEMADDLDEGE